MINSISTPVAFNFELWDKKNISELSAFANPPALVKLVTDSIQYLLGETKVDWKTSKKQLKNQEEFLNKLRFLTP